MKDYDYPDYQKHVGAHKLVDVRDKINKYEWRQRDVLVFMREWISKFPVKMLHFGRYLPDELRKATIAN